jgi:hypothetical protein
MRLWQQAIATSARGFGPDFSPTDYGKRLLVETITSFAVELLVRLRIALLTFKQVSDMPPGLERRR